MAEEFDSGFEVSESMSDFSDDSSLDVASIMDETPDFFDVDDFSDGDFTDEDALDVGAIMDEADAYEEPEMIEEVPLEEEIPEEPEIIEEVPMEEEIPEEPEMIEEVPVEEEIPEEPEMIEEVPVEEEIPEEPEMIEEVPVEEEIPEEPEIIEEVPAEEEVEYSADTPAEMPDIGPGPAQTAMSEYLSEHNYGREDYEEYSKDPQWQQLNNDLLVELGEEPIEYPQETESVVEVSSQQVLEDSGTERVYDDFEEFIRVDQEDFYESGSFYTQGINEYGYTGTCGETSMASTMNRVLGTNEFTENKVLDVAVQEGLCDTGSFDDSGGTTTDQFVELYDRMNEVCGDQLEIERHDFENVLSMEEAAQRLDEGCTLNVAVDSDTLWDVTDPMGSPFPETRATDHWITVTGVQRNQDGSIRGFDIIDSGGGENYVDAEKYEAMCYGTEQLELTDPTCIVVSRKEEPTGAIEQMYAEAGSCPEISPATADAVEEIPMQLPNSRVFASDDLYQQFSAYPEDSDDAFALQRQIYQDSAVRRGGVQ